MVRGHWLRGPLYSFYIIAYTMNNRAIYGYLGLGEHACAKMYGKKKKKEYIVLLNGQNIEDCCGREVWWTRRGKANINFFAIRTVDI